MTILMMDCYGYDGLVRNAKHKGYGKVIAMVYPTAQEIEAEKEKYRYILKRYKSISELYNIRKCDDPAWKEMCDRLEVLYPSKSHGQLQLH